MKTFFLVAIGLVLLNCQKQSDHTEDTQSPNPPSSASERLLATDRALITYQVPGGNSEIYSMGVDGSNPVKLTDAPTYDSWWPKPSPDRKKILFYRAPKGTNEDYGQASLMTMDFDGSNLQTIIPDNGHSWTIQAHAEWSPNGQEIVMCGTQGGVVHIFVTDTSGTIRRQLTTTGGWNCDPAWSPDGMKIIFNRCATANCHSTYGNLDIFTMSSSDGSGLTALTSPDGHEDYDPYYSPDGTEIAWLYQANNTSWSGGGAWSIKKMNANGSSQIFLINDGNINSKPSWSLDGTKIFFHRMAPLEAVKWRSFYFLSNGTGRTEVLPFGAYSDSTVGNISYPSF